MNDIHELRKLTSPRSLIRNCAGALVILLFLLCLESPAACALTETHSLRRILSTALTSPSFFVSCLFYPFKT